MAASTAAAFEGGTLGLSPSALGRLWNRVGDGLESRVLGELGLVKNTRTLDVPSPGKNVQARVKPDSIYRGYGIFHLEIKNRKSLTLTPQIRGELKVAAAEDAPLFIVVGARTKSISKNVLNDIQRSNGQVIQRVGPGEYRAVTSVQQGKIRSVAVRFDQRTGTFVNAKAGIALPQQPCAERCY